MEVARTELGIKHKRQTSRTVLSVTHGWTLKVKPRVSEDVEVHNIGTPLWIFGYVLSDEFHPFLYSTMFRTFCVGLYIRRVIELVSSPVR